MNGSVALFPIGVEQLVSAALWELELGNRFPLFEDIFPLDNQYREQILYSSNGRSKLERLAEESSFLAEEKFTAHHVRLITHGKNWEQRLDWVVKQYQAVKPLAFKPAHIAKIMRGKDWDKKLDWITTNYKTVLQPLGFNGSHVSQIVIGADWDKKLEWIAENYKTVLEPMGFNGYHVSQIFTYADWDKKLNWITANYKTVLQPLGFNGSHVSQIVTNADWDKKLEWIAENYKTVLEPMGFNGYHVSQIVTNADWDKKLEWIAKNYSLYLQYGLTSWQVAVSVYGASWREWCLSLEEKRDLLDEIHIDDERISPLAERYLFQVAFSDQSKETIERLIERATSEHVEQFKDNMTVLAGREPAATAEAVYGHLKRQHGYSPEEVMFYLKALGKNSRGLLSWYNTGVMYAPRERAMSENIERTAAGRERFSEEWLQQEERRMSVLSLFKKHYPRAYGLVNRLLTEYEGDVEAFDEQERKEFDALLLTVRQDKQVLANLYELLV